MTMPAEFRDMSETQFLQAIAEVQALRASYNQRFAERAARWPSLTFSPTDGADSLPRGIPWGELSAPIDPDETLLRMRAQSALSGPELGVVHDLTVEQARCVLAWYDPKH